MTPDPDDVALLKFVAEFCGWTEIQTYGDRPELCGRHDDWQEVEWIPDYLCSVDAWIRDVTPKMRAIGTEFVGRWAFFMMRIMNSPDCGWIALADAPARDRCLALYRALDGTLPDTKRSTT